VRSLLADDCLLFDFLKEWGTGIRTCLSVLPKRSSCTARRLQMGIYNNAATYIMESVVAMFTDNSRFSTIKLSLALDTISLNLKVSCIIPNIMLKKEEGIHRSTTLTKMWATAPVIHYQYSIQPVLGPLKLRASTSRVDLMTYWFLATCTLTRIDRISPIRS
jgi:hypothetical protein